MNLFRVLLTDVVLGNLLVLNLTRRPGHLLASNTQCCRIDGESTKECGFLERKRGYDSAVLLLLAGSNSFEVLSACLVGFVGDCSCSEIVGGSSAFPAATAAE